MKIAIIGSGNVGGTLGRRWAKNGHSVTFSSRNPQSEEMKKLTAESGTTAGTVAEAVRSSDVVLLATPWDSTKAAVESAGDLAGKVIIDAINPLTPQLTLALGITTSAGEQVASWAQGAKVVKAFNTIGATVMANTDFGGRRPVLFYCGDDASAKKTVHDLAAELGFDPNDAGPLTQARVLEPFAQLWISLAFGGYGQGIAFQFLRR